MVQSPCDEGWTYAEGQCFKYYHLLNHVTWWNFDRAEQECQLEAAHLATVDSAKKYQAVAELIRHRPLEVSYGERAGIGMRSRPVYSNDGTEIGRAWTWTGK